MPTSKDRPIRSNAIALLLAGLTHLVSVPGSADTLGYVNLGQTIQVDSMAEAEEILSVLKVKTSDARPVPLDSMEFFRSNLAGQAWSFQGTPRALTVGRPLYCSFSRIVWPYAPGNPKRLSEPVEDGWDLVKRSFAGCLKHAEDFEAVYGMDCKCQLVAVDDILLVEPARMQFGNLIPMLFYLGEGGRSSTRVERTLVAFSSPETATLFRGDGTFALYDKWDEQECIGAYSVETSEDGESSGKLSADCFNGSMEGSFTFVEADDDWQFVGYLAKRFGARIVLGASSDPNSIVEKQAEFLPWFVEPD